MKVKGKRTLKNGAVAGYVLQSDGSYKWRIISGPKKTKKGGSWGSVMIKKQNGGGWGQIKIKENMVGGGWGSAMIFNN